MHDETPHPFLPAAGGRSNASLGYQIGLVSRLLAQSLKKRNGRAGILPGQFPIALALLSRDGMTQRELCDVVRIDQSTMAITLKRMHRDDIVLKRACAHDGRQSTIHLTDKGRALAEIAVENAAQVNRVAFAALDDDAQAQFRVQIEGILARLQQDVYGDTPAADGQR